MSNQADQEAPYPPSHMRGRAPDPWDLVAVLSKCLISQRTELLRALARGPCPVGDLAAALALDIRVVSHHLELLRRLGVVVCRRHRNLRIYRLSDHTRLERRADEVHLTLALPGYPRITVVAADAATRACHQQDLRLPASRVDAHGDGAGKKWTIRPDRAMGRRSESDGARLPGGSA